MNFVILVPIAWLPLLVIAMVLGDYLFTMVAWFVLALVADVILYVLLMPVPPADAAGFAICLLLIPFLAPFVGLHVRCKREQRQEQQEELRRAERKRQEDLKWAKRKRQDDFERERYLLSELERRND
jgi:membrane protein implicated in regulation of membrane protease activity